MVTSMILVVALTGQVSAEQASREKALLDAVHARSQSPEVKAKMAADKVRQGQNQVRSRARWESERPAREAAAKARYEAAKSAFEADVKAQKEAQRQYERALPFLLEAQRQQLERLSAWERNVALHRIALASERIANAITLDITAGQNARFGYSTPALNTFGPGVTPYGPYGGVMYPSAAPSGPPPRPYVPQNDPSSPFYFPVP